MFLIDFSDKHVCLDRWNMVFKIAAQIQHYFYLSSNLIALFIAKQYNKGAGSFFDERVDEIGLMTFSSNAESPWQGGPNLTRKEESRMERWVKTIAICADVITIIMFLNEICGLFSVFMGFVHTFAQSNCVEPVQLPEQTGSCYIYKYIIQHT